MPSQPIRKVLTSLPSIALKNNLNDSLWQGIASQVNSSCLLTKRFFFVPIPCGRTSPYVHLNHGGG